MALKCYKCPARYEIKSEYHKFEYSSDFFHHGVFIETKRAKKREREKKRKEDFRELSI